MCVEMWIYFSPHSPWRVRIWAGNLRSVNNGNFCFGRSEGSWFVSLSMPFNQHCGASYLRSKSYLVFIISSDIMTKHCCQICVLSMMFCRSDSRMCADMVSDCAIRKTWVPRGLTTLRQANVGNEKYSLHLIFTFYLNRDTSVIELCPVVVFQYRVDPFTGNIETVSKIVGLW